MLNLLIMLKEANSSFQAPADTTATLTSVLSWIFLECVHRLLHAKGALQKILASQVAGSGRNDTRFLSGWLGKLNC